MHHLARVLLAIVDGFNGVQASEAALGITRDRAERLVAASEQVFRDEVMEVVSAVSERLGKATRSRTLSGCRQPGRPALRTSLPSATPRCSAAARSSRPRPANDLVLGPGGFRAELPLELWYAGFERQPGERVALVTDGVTNFVQQPSDIPKLISQARDDTEAAVSVARAAIAARSRRQRGRGDDCNS